MRKFIINYTGGALSIVTVLDSSTNEEVIAKAPMYQTNVSYRDIVDNDIPLTHYDIRGAWEDTQSGTQIDVSHTKAKDELLARLRAKRDSELERLDKLKIRADELGDTTLSNSILTDKNTLRDCTDALKNTTVSGHNDDVVLQDLKDKAVLPTIGN